MWKYAHQVVFFFLFRLPSSGDPKYVRPHNHLDQSCHHVHRELLGFPRGSSIVLNVFPAFSGLQLPYHARPAGRLPVPGSSAPFPPSDPRSLSGRVGTFGFSLYSLSHWPSLHLMFFGNSVFGFLFGAWPVPSQSWTLPPVHIFLWIAVPLHPAHAVPR